MIKMQLISFFLSYLIIVFVHSTPPQQYRPTTTASLISSLQKLIYSHNQRILVGFQNEAEDEFFAFDGLKLNNQQTITLKDQRKQRVSPSTFAFSKNDDLLIVGSKQGGVYGFKIINNTISTTYDYSFVIGPPKEQNWIRAIAFSTQNKIAISSKMTLIILDRQQATGNFVQIQRHSFIHTIYALTWSILEPTAVIVGTLGLTEGEFLLYDLSNNESHPINNDKTQSLAVFPDGKTILKGTVGKDLEVYTYQTGASPLLKTTVKDTNDTKEIYVSSNGQYFAIRTNAGQVKAWYVQNNAAFSNLKNQDTWILSDFLPSLNQTGKGLTLSSSGGDIIIILNDGSALLTKYSLCENKTYFNQQSLQCQACSQNCNTCFNTQTCITCNPDKFISGDQCKACGSKLDGCITCSSQETCLTCNQNEQWNSEAKNGKCQCKNTFYNNLGKCSTCSAFLDCFECTRANYCTSCKDEGNFNPKPIDGLCVCKDTFWINNTLCTECSLAIDDCQLCSQDGSKCKQCQSPDRKPNTQQSKCICVDYKYEDQTTKKCEFCDPNQNCVTCQPYQPYKCIKCDAQKHFQQQPKDGKCLCQASYFIDEGKCSLCSGPLLDCQFCDSREKCLLCKNENNFNTTPVDGKCVCIEKWILVGQICELCSNKINGCLTCSSQTNCTVCDESAYFDKTAVEGNCKCMAEYWLNDKVCERCSSKVHGCKTCTQNGVKCLTCEDQSRQPSEDGQSCLCKPFTYENAQDQTCQPCDTKHSCVHCQTNNNHECIICDANGHWNSTPVSGKCQCMDGYNEYSDKCIFCLIPGCTVCPSQSTCEQCSEAKKFLPDPIHDECKCKVGTRASDDKTQCIDCNVTILGCKQCSNAHNCQICDLSNHFVIDSTLDICHCDKGWYLKSNLCQNCTQAIDNCLYCSADLNGNNVECSQCKNGWGTAPNKKTCISCKNIGPGCINCDQSSKCTACDKQNGFIMNGTTCSCTKEHYIKGEGCEICSVPIPGCKQCNDQNTCTNCSNDGMFNPIPNPDNKCDCVAGWILDQEKCVNCAIITGCLICSSIQTCTTCNGTAHFQLTQDKKCQCKEDYYIDGEVCKLCNQKIPNCLECSKNGNTCQKCSDPNRVLNDKKNQCICQQFMYENNEKVCEFCDENRNCKQCTEKNNCTICDINKKWQEEGVDGKCVCQTGYQEWNNQCLLCQVNGCAQCHEENKCFKCQTIKKFAQEPVDGVCKCSQNTILDGNQCFECGQKLIGCEQCVNLNECTDCNAKNYFIRNQTTKKCQCDSNHYFVTPNCVACSRGIDYCSECNIDGDKKECLKCQIGFIVDPDNEAHCLNCQELIVGCSNCIDTKTCRKCNQGENFEPYENECVCKKGYFLQSSECISCSIPIPGCLDCDKQGKQCSSCDQSSNFKPNNQTGKCECTKGFYLDDHSCDECKNKLSACAECQNDGSKCLACQDGFYLLEGQCMKCSTKTSGCTKCSLDGEQCSQCNTDHFIFNEKTLKCDCENTYFLEASECKLCSSELLSCKECSKNGKQCLECQGNNFILNPETNYCQCNSSYYLHDNSTCKLCTEIIAGCSKCNQQGSSCFQCNKKENFVLNDTSCSCTEGYFLNKTQKTCNLCSVINPGCTKCSADGQQSLECNMINFIFNNVTNKCQCIQGYFIASNTECKLCNKSIEFCQSCSSSLSNNFEDLTAKCNECQDTFTLNEDKTQCICQGDNKEIVGGVCKNKQNSSNWLLYGGIAAGIIILLGIGVFIYIRRKKAKLVKLDRYNELEDENDNGRSVKPQTILTSDSADKKVFKSSVYNLEDQK